MRILTSILLIATASCGGTVSLEPAQGGYILTAHGSTESVASCLGALAWSEPLQAVHGLRWESQRGTRRHSHHGKILLVGVPVDVDLIAFGRSTQIELMSTRPKASGKATTLVVERLRLCGIESDPIDLGEIGR